MTEPNTSSADATPLDQMRSERDALRRELGDLRAWLCVKLRLVERTPGPQGLTTLTIASDKEIITKIEELMRDAGKTEDDVS